MKKIIFSLVISAFPISTLALDASDLSNLEGYTVIASTKFDGDFEGCDYNRKIPLLNGWILECNIYHYSYSFMPDVVIFSRDIGAGYSIKAVIGDYVYDMNPVRK